MMPHIETEELIGQYYEQVKEQYPNISFEHFIEICKTPFRYIRSQMERGDLPTVNVKYFGVFKVTSAKVARMLKDLDLVYYCKSSVMTEQEYEEKKVYYTKLHEERVIEEQIEDDNYAKGDLLKKKTMAGHRQVLQIIDDTEEPIQNTEDIQEQFT